MAVELPSFPLNEKYYTAEDFRLYMCTRTNGIYSSDSHFKVSAVINQPLRISINPGIAWMKYAEFNGIVMANKTAQTLDLEVAPASLSRIDRVVLRYNIDENKTEMDVKTGTVSSSPQAPLLQRDSSIYELGIADITIRAGRATLINSNISDKRMSEKLCGLMRDGVTEIPTQALFDSWESWFVNLQTDAENQAEIFTEWMETFKSANIDGFEEWIETFKSTYSEMMSNWFDSNSSIFEDQFRIWFSDLQNTLDENQEVNLLQKIEQHEQSDLVTNEPHGMRLYNGEFQVNDGIGWITLARVKQGLTAGYADGRHMTAMNFDSLQLTAKQFDNLIERE